MISGLLNNLIGQYNLANAPNPAPAVSDPNNLSGLLQTTGIPLTSNPIGNRTPDYMSLLGMMGQQPFTPGYTPVGGGEATGTPTSDYLNRVLSGLNQTQTGNLLKKPTSTFTPKGVGPWAQQYWMDQGVDFGLMGGGPTYGYRDEPWYGAYMQYLSDQGGG